MTFAKDSSFGAEGEGRPKVSPKTRSGLVLCVPVSAPAGFLAVQTAYIVG
ncbi:hypothetical protein BaRGS_00015565 [Batillaria attramentaria]|uniref:Uncharacterized protein n=1 Tax=Batillaria attramentaria TaxID=370345 RepID=A0ABD0L1N0_9CAEN